MRIPYAATNYDEVRSDVKESQDRSLEALQSANALDARSVGTELDEVDAPELGRHLKPRSAFIDFTLEDITRITDTIYRIDADPGAVPPPADRTFIGR